MTEQNQQQKTLAQQVLEALDLGDRDVRGLSLTFEPNGDPVVNVVFNIHAPQLQEIIPVLQKYMLVKLRE